MFYESALHVHEAYTGEINIITVHDIRLACVYLDLHDQEY